MWKLSELVSGMNWSVWMGSVARVAAADSKLMVPSPAARVMTVNEKKVPLSKIGADRGSGKLLS